MPTIGDLHLSSRPTAVRRLVISIIVYAIDGELWIRTAPHISKKIRVVIPSFAERYASTTIIFVRLAFWIIASLAQSIPRFIFRRLLVMDSVPVFTGKIQSEAAAGFRNPPLEVVGESDACVSTIAAAKPATGIAEIIDERKDNELSEAFTGNIDAFRHAV